MVRHYNEGVELMAAFCAVCLQDIEEQLRVRCDLK